MSKVFGKILLVTLLCCMLAGCGETKPVPDLGAAYHFAGQYQWEPMYPIVKNYLKDHPDDPGAHFLYGQYHLHRKTPYFFIAEGELEMAITLLQQQGEVGALRDIITKDQLEGAAHRELALLYMRLCQEGADNYVTNAVLIDWLRKSLAHVEQGLALDPEHKFLLEMKEALVSMLNDFAVPLTPQGAI